MRVGYTVADVLMTSIQNEQMEGRSQETFLMGPSFCFWRIHSGRASSRKTRGAGDEEVKTDWFRTVKVEIAKSLPQHQSFNHQRHRMKKTMTIRFASKMGGLQGIDSNIE